MLRRSLLASARSRSNSLADAVSLWRRRTRCICCANAKVAELEWDRNGKIRGLLALEVRRKLLEYFRRHVQMLAFDEPSIGLPIPLLEYSLSRYFARQPVRRASFTRDDDRKRSDSLIAESIKLANGSGQIGKMLQYV